MLQQSQLMRLHAPDPAELAGFRNWLKCLEGGPSEKNLWDNENDLVAILARQDDTDHFTRWIYRKGLPWFHKCCGNPLKVFSETIHASVNSQTD